MILLDLLLAVLGTAMVWKSSSWIEIAAQRIADHYGLPEIVKGSIITAVASSFPELSSVLLATLLHGEFELGVAAVVGSAIFNILVIPAVSVLSGGPLQANRELVFKESLFYLIAVSVLMLSFSFAVIYYPISRDPLQGTLTRGLAAIPIALYVLYLFLQYQDTRDQERIQQPSPDIARAWWSLLLGVLFVAVGVELLVRFALHLGDAMGTPSFLWGMTVVAAGTSLPDLFISVTASREGRDITSLSNVLGSNTFDLLVAAPMGVLIAGATVIDFSRAVPMMACLTIATFALFVLMRVGMGLRRMDAYLLLALYGVFVAWVVLEAVGLARCVQIS